MDTASPTVTHRTSPLTRFSRWFSRAQGPVFSIVICSIDTEKFRRVKTNYESAFATTAFELIAIHDAKSLAEAYNRAISRAKGDIIIFSHDDIRLVTPNFSAHLLNHFKQFDVIGVAGTTRLVGGAWFLGGDPFDYQLVTSPHKGSDKYVIVGRGRGPLVVESAQALDGLFMAAKRQVAQKIRFDAETFDGFHCYDIDFTFRAHLAGYRIGICRDLFVIHESHGKFDEVWQRYRQRFESKFHDSLSEPSRPPCPSPISNVLLDRELLSNPAAVKELCAPQSLIGFLPH